MGSAFCIWINFLSLSDQVVRHIYFSRENRHLHPAAVCSCSPESNLWALPESYGPRQVSSVRKLRQVPGLHLQTEWEKLLQGLSAPLQSSAELGMDSVPEKMLMTLVSGASFLAFSHRQDNPAAFTGESHEGAASWKPHPKFSPATGWPWHQGWTSLRPPDHQHWPTDWSRDPCPHLHLHF